MTAEAVDWPSLFDVVVDGLPPADLHVRRIVTDDLRGHIVLDGAPEHGGPGRPVALADLGGALHLWSGQGCLIDAPRAREFAAALTWWAERAEAGAA